MTEPTELEKKIAERISALQYPYAVWYTPEKVEERLEFEALLSLAAELTLRRLKAEYLGQSSITGRDSSQERID